MSEEGVMNTRWTAGLLIAGLALAFAGGSAWAQDGGAAPNERGTPEQGMAGAGNPARAEDAATAHYNAAGMTRLDRDEAMVGLALMSADLKFDSSSRTRAFPPGSPVKDGGQAGGTVPLGGSYVVFGVNERTKVGLTINSLYGGGVDYDDDWVGRTLVTESTLAIVNIEPAVAYKIDDRWSIGGSLNILYAKFDLEFRAAALRGAPTIKVEDADDWNLGYTLLNSLTVFRRHPRCGESPFIKVARRECRMPDGGRVLMSGHLFISGFCILNPCPLTGAGQRCSEVRWAAEPAQALPPLLPVFGIQHAYFTGFRFQFHSRDNLEPDLDSLHSALHGRN